MRQVLIVVVCFGAILAVLPRNSAAAGSARPLQIYFIDVEGGQATLS